MLKDADNVGKRRREKGEESEESRGDGQWEEQWEGQRLKLELVPKLGSKIEK